MSPVRLAFAVPLLLLAAAVVIACDDDEERLAPTPSPSPVDVCLPNPEPATADDQIIDQPLPFASAASPLTVAGRIVAFEATYQIAIYDADGVPLAETFGTSGPAEIGELARFSIDVTFDVSTPTPACLWVYEASARDGSPVNVGQVPITLLPGPAGTLTPPPNVCLPNPEPADAADQVIDQPLPFAFADSPLTVAGRIVAFEATYQIAIYDADGGPLAETFGTAGPAEVGDLAPFSIEVEFDVTEPVPACLWVYEESARDGSPVNVGQVPLLLVPQTP
jgi:hypothetical protein